MANKRWMTKIKRLRLPDLVCVRCGRRIESKAKSKLELRLSHSTKEGRAWHGDMRPQDLVAFLLVELDPADQLVGSGSPSYFSIQALNEAPFKENARKSSTEGSELDIQWPAAVPTVTGTVVAMTGGRIKLAFSEHGRLRSRTIGNSDFIPYVRQGDIVRAEKTIVSGAVTPAEPIGCPGHIWNHADDLRSEQTVDRYAAVKTVGALRTTQHLAVLRNIANHDEDLRVRLEAVGSLAALGEDPWTRVLSNYAHNSELPDGLAMEAVFLLSEIGSDAAADALTELAAIPGLPSELRAAAVWGLGSVGVRRYEDVWPYTDDGDELVRVHAVGALGEVSDQFAKVLVDALRGNPNQAAVASRLLAREHRIDELLEAVQQPEARTWALESLGRIHPAVVDSHGGAPHDVLEALQPAWAGRFGPWLGRDDAETDLRLLDGERLRVPPTTFLVD